MGRKKKFKPIILTKTKHPLCLKDQKGNCEYFTKISCGECMFNTAFKRGKDPRAKINKLI